MNLISILAILFIACAILASVFAMISSKRMHTLYKNEITLSKTSSNTDALLTQRLNTALETAVQQKDQAEKALKKLKTKFAATEKKLAETNKKLKTAKAQIETIGKPTIPEPEKQAPEPSLQPDKPIDTKMPPEGTTSPVSEQAPVETILPPDKKSDAPDQPPQAVTKTESRDLPAKEITEQTIESKLNSETIAINPESKPQMVNDESKNTKDPSQ